MLRGFITAGACLVVVAVAHAGPAVPLRLWIAPSGNDAGTCTSAAPCASFARAYLLATPGQVVQVGAGSYGPQVIPHVASKDHAAKNVLFQVADGVTIDGDLTVYGSHVTVRGSPRTGLRVHTLYSRVSSANATSHQLFEYFRGATFQIWGTHFVTIRDSDWGPGNEPADSESRITPDGGVLNSYPTRILLDHITIHDQNSIDLQQHHNGGLELVAGRYIEIKDSTFVRNVVYDIEVQDFTTPDCCGMKYGNATNVTLVGNRFGAPVLGPPYGTAQEPAGQPEVQFDPRGGGWSSWTIRNNVFEEGLATAFDGPGSFYRNFVVERNIMGGLSDCGGVGQGAVWQENIISGGRCASEGAAVPFGYRLSGASLVPSDAAAAVRVVFAHAAAGGSLSSALAAVRKGGGARPQGGWTVPILRRVLSDPVYLGGRYGPAGAQPGLVTRAVWRAAQKALRP